MKGFCTPKGVSSTAPRRGWEPAPIFLPASEPSPRTKDLKIFEDVRVRPTSFAQPPSFSGRWELDPSLFHPKGGHKESQPSQPAIKDMKVGDPGFAQPSYFFGRWKLDSPPHHLPSDPGGSSRKPPPPPPFPFHRLWSRASGRRRRPGRWNPGTTLALGRRGLRDFLGSRGVGSVSGRLTYWGWFRPTHDSTLGLIFGACPQPLTPPPD